MRKMTTILKEAALINFIQLSPWDKLDKDKHCNDINYIWNQERKPKLIKTESRMVVTKVWSVKGTVKMFKDTDLQLVNKKVLKI